MSHGPQSDAFFYGAACSATASLLHMAIIAGGAKRADRCREGRRRSEVREAGEPMNPSKIQGPLAKAKKPKTEQVNMRLSTEDRTALMRIVRKHPILKAATLARFAMRLGLAAVDEDPSLLFRPAGNPEALEFFEKHPEHLERRDMTDGAKVLGPRGKTLCLASAARREAALR